MKKRAPFYILSFIIGIAISITMIIHSQKKIDLLEERIVECQNLQTETNSVSTTLQESLNEANERNTKLENQIKEHDINIEDIKKHYGDYQGNDDFSDVINDNPIDKDYRIEFDELQKSDNFTTLAMGAMEVNYTTRWEDEVNAALTYLYKELNEQDSINLKKAQKSWQRFMNDDYSFVSDKFVYTGYFGTQGKVQIETVRLQRTRDRAIELMEYIFSMDRTAVDFVYDN